MKKHPSQDAFFFSVTIYNRLKFYIMVQNFLLKLKVLAELIMSSSIGYAAFVYTFSSILVNILLIIVSLFILVQALGTIDKLNGYNTGKPDDDKHHPHSPGFPDHHHHTTGFPDNDDDETGNQETGLPDDYFPDDEFPDNDADISDLTQDYSDFSE